MIIGINLYFEMEKTFIRQQSHEAESYSLTTLTQTINCCEHEHCKYLVQKIERLANARHHKK